MLTAHQCVAFLVLAVTCGARRSQGSSRTAGAAARACARRTCSRSRRRCVVAQVGLGLLLLSDGRRAPDRLHYAYGTFALLAVLAPWLYAPAEPRRRLLWFAGATLVAAALAVRAYMTAHEALLRDMNPTCAGFAIVALIAVVIVVLQLQTTLDGAVPARADRLLPRGRVLRLHALARAPRATSRCGRGGRSRVFYGAAAAASSTFGWYSPAAQRAWTRSRSSSCWWLCGFAMWRVWRDQHTYG